jgi:3-hydroxyisobutyrate dehydrogenase
VSPEQPTVAVLGIGIMGGPMARNIAKAGVVTRVWNRTREKAEAVAQDGAAAFDTPAEAVEGADVVLTMLADGPTVESVMTEGGALAAMRDGAIWAQTSTVGVDAVERLAGLAKERGVAFLDSPVLGTRVPAEKGELTVLAAGPADAVDACRPVFEAIGTKTLRLGEPGEAMRLKLVLNKWLLSLLDNLAETIAFAERIGVDPKQLLEALDGSTVGSPYAQMKGPLMLARDFSEVSFSLGLALKDLELVIEAAERYQAHTPMTRATTESFAKAVEKGHADEDMASVYCAYAD